MLRRLLNAALVASLLLVAGYGTIRAVPPTPYGPFGTVKINDAWVVEGTPVLAFCSGLDVGSTTAQLVGTTSRYSMSVAGDDPDTAEVDGCLPGETVFFTVDGWPADQTGTWKEGQSKQINLTAFRPEPAIRVEKSTNGEAADEPPGPTIAVGETVAWTFSVTNTGNVPLTDVLVSDDVLGAVPCPQSSLAVNEGMTCTETRTAEAGQHANEATAQGTYDSTTVSDTDPSHYFGEDARIAIEKRTNGERAPAPPGVFVGAGDPITWTYHVTNTGNVGLTAVVVADSDPDVVVDCGPSTLGPEESMTCQATGTAAKGQYGNTAVVTGTSPLGLEVSDSDASHYFGAVPGLIVSKATNGEDADNPPGPYILVGDVVTWTYVVTNTGNVDVEDVQLVDDQEGVDISCPASSLVAGESMTCEATGIATEGQYVNTVTASAVPVVGDTVTAEATSHYFGADPRIEVDKRTNGEDVAEPPGPTLWVGDEVTWTYAVRNTGNVTLTEVAVTDDQVAEVTCPATTLAPDEETVCSAEGAATAGQYTNVATASGRPPGLLAPVEGTDTSHYFGVTPFPSIGLEKRTNGSLAAQPPGVYIVVGDPVTWTFEIVNTGNITLTAVTLEDDVEGVIPCDMSELASTAYATCTWTGTAAVGPYRNEAVVTAVSPSGTVTDSAVSHYFGIEPSIAVAKLTNGYDADVPPGPLVASGDPITWTFVVTNTGNITLTNVALVDTIEGDVMCPETELGPDEAVICSHYGVAEVGQYTNVVTATARPPAGADVGSTDVSHYFGASSAIAIEKRTAGPEGPVEDGGYIDAGAALTWTYTVTNTGNVTLTNVLVMDDREGPVDCPTELLPGQAVVCQKAGAAEEGPYTNMATVTATSPVHVDVMDHDTSGYFGAAPGVAVEKRTAGVPARSAPGPTILVGEPITWTYVVTNTGNITLTDVIVIDDPEGAADCARMGLAPGESTTCELASVAGVGPYSNTVSVTGTPASGGVVTATDVSHYFGASPALTVELAVSPDWGETWFVADEPPGPSIDEDIGPTFMLTVTNTGNVDLGDFALTVEGFDSEMCPPPEPLSVGQAFACEVSGDWTEGQARAAATVRVVFQDDAGITMPVEATGKAYYVGAADAHRVFLPLVIR